MGFNPIRLTRNVLSEFLPDPDSIRQFEKLIDAVSNSGDIEFITEGTGTEYLSDAGVYRQPVHDELVGLANDDHTQYHNDARALTWLGTRSTSDLPEGANFYWTQGRFDTAFTAKSTSDLSEGTNLYYTAERVDDQVDTLIQNGTGLTWTYNDGVGTLTGNVSLSVFSTSDLSEGTNLYYTESRVNSNRKDNILEYGYEGVTASVTVTKTKTVFSGSTTGQTITLPTVGTSGRQVEVFNNGTVMVSISGSSVLGELYANESACFTDTGSDWIA